MRLWKVDVSSFGMRNMTEREDLEIGCNDCGLRGKCKWLIDGLRPAYCGEPLFLIVNDERIVNEKA